MPTEQYDFKDWLEIISSLIVIFAVPIAIWRYFKNAKGEKQKNGYLAYDSLDKEYTEWQKLCLQYIDLPISDVDNCTEKDFQALPPTDKKKIKLIYTILVSIFERAYILYNTRYEAIEVSGEFKERQWNGWKEYMKSYSQSAVFKIVWQEIGTDYDKDFHREFDKLSAQTIQSTSVEK
jgi:hypothetical protein